MKLKNFVGFRNLEFNLFFSRVDCELAHSFSAHVIGQHDCVTVINNFFSRARLEFYTRPQGLETEPKLPPMLAGPLHKIIMTTNLNPVKVRPNKEYMYVKKIHLHLIVERRSDAYILYVYV